MRRVAIGAFVVLASGIALAADDKPSVSVLDGKGTVYVNGQKLTTTTMAVMTGDVIQTKDDSAAHVNSAGSLLTAGANTIVRLQTGGTALDRGTVLVGTGTASIVLARDFKITPVSSSWTQFNVSRSSGVIQILAVKNDVTVTCGSGKPITVKEGQQLSREDAADCGFGANPNASAPPAAQGPILASPTAQKAALAVGGGLAAWAIFQAEDSVSPSVP